MNRIDDERIKFYLKHQERIEEWAALSKDVSGVAHRFLCSCQDDIEALAGELGPDVHIHAHLESDYPKLLLYRPAWHPQNSRHEASIPPRIGVGIEWRHKDVTFVGHESSAYVGVWVDCGNEAGRHFRDKAVRVFREERLLTEPRRNWATSWWPSYGWARAQGEYWDDLSLYRQQLVDCVRSYWQKFAPTIDRLVT